jgi:hypothetical protein
MLASRTLGRSRRHQVVTHSRKRADARAPGVWAQLPTGGPTRPHATRPNWAVAVALCVETRLVTAGDQARGPGDSEWVARRQRDGAATALMDRRSQRPSEMCQATVPNWPPDGARATRVAAEGGRRSRVSPRAVTHERFVLVQLVPTRGVRHAVSRPRARRTQGAGLCTNSHRKRPTRCGRRASTS